MGTRKTNIETEEKHLFSPFSNLNFTPGTSPPCLVTACRSHSLPLEQQRELWGRLGRSVCCGQYVVVSLYSLPSPTFAVAQVCHRLQRPSAVVWVLRGLQETPAPPWSPSSSGPGGPSAASCSFLFPFSVWFFCPYLNTFSLRHHCLGWGAWLCPAVGPLGLAGTGWLALGSPCLSLPLQPASTQTLLLWSTASLGWHMVGQKPHCFKIRKLGRNSPIVFWGPAQQGGLLSRGSRVCKTDNTICLRRDYFGSWKFCIYHLCGVALPTL